MKSRNLAGLTAVEIIVALAIICILVALALPAITSTPNPGGQRTHTLSNMKQLHLATQSMALDGTTTGDTNLGWPGDIGGTFSNWAVTLVQSNYLTTRDLCKLLSAPGRIVSPEVIPTANDGGILVYTVKEDSGSDVVFLTSANFTNTATGGAPLDPQALPYGAKGFVVFRKGGDGAILLPKQVGQTNIIGRFVPLCR